MNKANRAYYNEAHPIIEDKQYDVLYDELKALEEETQIIYPNSPTQNVGYTVSDNLPKETHVSPMLSMDKTKSVDDLKEWLKDHDGILSWKLDGLTVVLTYNNGELLKAVTRGNGIVGEVITENAKHFKNIPLQIPYKKELIIRGEALISYSVFELINSKLPEEEKYKNPRNLASGSVRQLNSEIAEERQIIFKPFRLITEVVIDEKKLQYFDEQLQWLNSIGFDCVEYEKVDKHNLDQIVQQFSNRVAKLDYPVDGLVLTYNDVKYGLSLGNTAKFPRHSMAFKWADTSAETTLRQVEWQTSRTGLINPVAIFDSVELEGTTVNRATLNNVSFIKKMQLGLGDTLSVYKANMIIPTIEDNLTRSGTLEIPDRCPVCRAPTVVLNTKKAESLYCTNPNCQAKLIMKLKHFCSRNAMDITGFSDATLTFLINKRWVNNYWDLFQLSRYKKIWSNVPGYGQASVEKKLGSIDSRSKKVDSAKFLYGLGIPEVGAVQSKRLIKEFGDIYGFIKALQENFDFSQIENFGDQVNQNIYEWFKAQYKSMEIPKLIDLLEFAEPVSTKSAESKLDNLTFCITGEVHIMKNRNELKAYIESNGGKVVNSVSGKLSYLINNDVNSSSGKNKKAKELGIDIISEDEVLRLCQ